MTGPNTPWIKMMRNKYGCGSNPRHWARKTNSSHIWKCLYNTKNILTANTRWNVGNGENINVGLDWWCGKGPIKDTFNTTNGLMEENVSKLITGNGIWNNDLIQNTFPNHWVENISSVPLPISSVLQDSPS